MKDSVKTDVSTSPNPNIGFTTNSSTTVLSIPVPNNKPSTVRLLPSIKRPASPHGYTHKVARENSAEDQTLFHETRSRPRTRAPQLSQTPQPDSDTSRSPNGKGVMNSVSFRNNSSSFQNSSRLLEARPRTHEISSRNAMIRPESDGVVVKRKTYKKRRAMSAVSATPSPVRREAVVHVVYSGRPDHLGDHVYDIEDQGRASPRRRYMLESRASRMTTPTAEIGHCEYPVLEEDDCSLARSLSRSSVRTDRSGHRSPFLYQMIDFDNFTENVPSFVRQDVKRNGRLVTETFILKVNFLRRRRQLGETSTTMNPNAKKAQQLAMLSAGGGGGQGPADKTQNLTTSNTAD